MSKENRKRLHTACSIVTAVLVLAAGICFIASCLSIYRSGSRPFSPESVSTHFRQIRIPIIACIVSVVISAVLTLVFPLDAPKTGAIREEAGILAALKVKAGTLTDAEQAGSAAHEERRRGYISLIAGTAAVIGMLRLLLRFLDPANFTVENLNQDMLQLLLTIAVYAALFLGIFVLRSCLLKRSLLREISVYKAALAEKKCDGTVATPNVKKDTANTVLIARCVLCTAAVVFIVLGIFNGGIQDVLGKAIAICTECIGLG